MRPVLEEDELLMAVDDLLEAAGVLDVDGDEDDHDAGAQEAKMSCDPRQTSTAGDDNSKLQALLDRTRELEGRHPSGASSQEDGNEKEADDSYYFDSYSKIGIHYTMLRDTV